MGELDHSAGSRPIPDPTELTTALTLREIAALKELLETKLDGAKGVFETRLDGMDKAIAAALQAAEKAVGQQNKSSAEAIAKSEAATTEQIKSLNTLISTVAAALTSKIDDVKERQTIVQGHSKGIGDSIGYLIAIGTLVVAVVALVVYHK